jgi:hypothetical protein
MKLLLIDTPIGIEEIIGPEPGFNRLKLKRCLHAVRFWEAIANMVFPHGSLPGGFAETLDHRLDLRDGLCRRTEKREKAFPRVLPDQSQARKLSNRSSDNGIAVDLFQDGVEIVIQPEELSEERFFRSPVVKKVSSLPQGEDLIGSLDEIGIPDLGKTKELSAFQSILQGERMDA